MLCGSSPTAVGVYCTEQELVPEFGRVQLVKSNVPPSRLLVKLTVPPGRLDVPVSLSATVAVQVEACPITRGVSQTRVRSEERRVGEEGRERWRPEACKGCPREVAGR